MGSPAKVHSSIAGRPSGVPGILLSRLGRLALACSFLAYSMVATVSWTSSGETSGDTHPSTPSLRR